MHRVVVCGSKTDGLVEPGDEGFHPLAGADDELFVVSGGGLEEPVDGDGGFGLAVFGEEGGVADDAVAGGF